MNEKLNIGKNKNCNLVTVRVVSSNGHDEWTELPEVALTRIQGEVNSSRKWLFIDGVQQNPKNLTIDKLLNAKYITITYMIVGG